jgi:hypothetical protein
MIKNGIIGRNLEIWLPILYLSKQIDEQLFDNLLPYISNITKEKAETDISENRDVIFIDFLYNNIETNPDIFIQQKDIVKKYKEINPDDLWFNERWVGRALRRHKLITERIRATKGREVRININQLKKLADKLFIKKREIVIKNPEPQKETLDDFIQTV